MRNTRAASLGHKSQTMLSVTQCWKLSRTCGMLSRSFSFEMHESSFEMHESLSYCGLVGKSLVLSIKMQLSADVKT